MKKILVVVGICGLILTICSIADLFRFIDVWKEAKEADIKLNNGESIFEWIVTIIFYASISWSSFFVYYHINTTEETAHYAQKRNAEKFYTLQKEIENLKGKINKQ